MNLVAPRRKREGEGARPDTRETPCADCWSAAAAGLALTGLLPGLHGQPSGQHGRFGPAVASQRPSRPQPASGTADCDSVTTCYTPQQFQVAYGIKPLLDRGIDGRGETVVLPELAEPALNEPLVSNMRQDMTRFDQVFGLPAARLRVNTSLAGRVAHPWYAFGEEVLDAEMVHVIAPRATIVIDLVKNTALNHVKPAVAAAIAALRLAESQGGIVSESAVGQTGGENCDTQAEVASLHAALQARGRAPGHRGRRVRRHRRGRRAVHAGPQRVRWRAVHPGQGGQPARVRPARAGRGRHQPDRQP